MYVCQKRMYFEKLEVPLLTKLKNLKKQKRAILNVFRKEPDPPLIHTRSEGSNIHTCILNPRDNSKTRSLRVQGYLFNQLGRKSVTAIGLSDVFFNRAWRYACMYGIQQACILRRFSNIHTCLGLPISPTCIFSFYKCGSYIHTYFSLLIRQKYIFLLVQGFFQTYSPSLAQQKSDRQRIS